MANDNFPVGWNEAQVRRVLSHYEKQTDEEAAAEDEAAFKGKGQTVIEVPFELMPVIREVIAQYKAAARV